MFLGQDRQVKQLAQPKSHFHQQEIKQKKGNFLTWPSPSQASISSKSLSLCNLTNGKKNKSTKANK
jgi:hypothetical protein